jgi:hypothetical protein
MTRKRPIFITFDAVGGRTRVCASFADVVNCEEITGRAAQLLYFTASIKITADFICTSYFELVTHHVLPQT